MKDRPDLIALVCRPHCRFFKPGAKEEMSCRGFELFRERATEDQVAAWTSRLGRETPPQSIEHDPRIEQLICYQCNFREEDCDFMAAEPVPGSAPCGGYVLIARLLTAHGKEIEAWLK